VQIKIVRIMQHAAWSDLLRIIDTSIYLGATVLEVHMVIDVSMVCILFYMKHLLNSNYNHYNNTNILNYTILTTQINVEYRHHRGKCRMQTKQM
jgi:hypothetical protein